MLICGIKLTHDGGVALVETTGTSARLLWQIDTEKVDNGERYASLPSLEAIAAALRSEGVDPADVDAFVVDGWFASRAWAGGTVLPPDGPGQVLEVADYHETSGSDDPHRRVSGSFPLEGVDRPFHSYRHIANHVSAAYWTSPFAAAGEDSLVLAWDGGILPRLYRYDAAERRATFLRPLFPLMGHAYAVFGAHVEPFRPDVDLTSERFLSAVATAEHLEDAEVPEVLLRHNLTSPGKIMAYTGLATSVDPSVPSTIRRHYRRLSGTTMPEVLAFSRATVAELIALGCSSAEILAGFQLFVAELLTTSLERAVARMGSGSRPNLCLTGGCALNIKWNSAIRGTGLFESVWVPPFPNDSGAAFGAALSHLATRTDAVDLQWSVHAGPRLQPSAPPSSWALHPCPPEALGRLLHDLGEPVVVLDGRAELGPRALGHRSILAPAADAAMKDRLNHIKRREPYRPVAPMCLERAAADIFDPGGPEPHMLFDHRLRPEWHDRIPAIAHIDGTARLQTVEAVAAPLPTRILESYAAASGIPVLCNTSANHPGCGFFPDVASAVEWGEVDLVWSGDQLYERSAAGLDVAAHLLASPTVPG